MDRMIRSSHTAPVKLETPMAKQARLLSELDRAETCIRAERERLGKRRDSEQRKFNIAVNLGPQTTMQTKVAHGFCSVLAEWTYEAEIPKLHHAQYLVRKLTAAINGGCRLREESDVELAYVRQVMNGIKS